MASARMTASNASTSPSLHAATTFLTRPLSLINHKFNNGTTLCTLQLFLHSALLATSRTRTFCLSLSSSEHPPLPIHLACVASGIQWSDWIRALGGSAFTLHIEADRVYVVRQDNGRVGIVWAASCTAASAAGDSDATSSDGDEETCSRPSSRSSNFSTFSFSSHASGSSQSSVASSIHGTEVPKSASPTSPKSTSPPTPSNPTRYVYQGGISTVLTGGVMLGSSKPAAVLSTHPPSTSAIPTPKKAVYVPPHCRARTTTTISSGRYSAPK